MVLVMWFLGEEISCVLLEEHLRRESTLGKEKHTELLEASRSF